MESSDCIRAAGAIGAGLRSPSELSSLSELPFPGAGSIDWAFPEGKRWLMYGESLFNLSALFCVDVCGCTIGEL
jgi:hypothetical protein